MISEILSVVKVIQNKVYLNKNVLAKFHFKEEDNLMWYINENDELVLSRSNKIEPKKIVTSDLESVYKLKKSL